HADIDPAEVSKNRHAEVPIVGDAREVLADLVVAVRSEQEKGRQGDYEAWWHQLERLQTTYPKGYDQPTDESLSPQHVIERLGRIVRPEATIVAGVGHHQMWAAQFIDHERPGAFVNPGGLGTTGFSVPAALGAEVGDPDRAVWSVDGDGCFQ